MDLYFASSNKWNMNRIKTGVAREAGVQLVSTGQYRRHEQRWGTLSNNHQASAGINLHQYPYAIAHLHTLQAHCSTAWSWGFEAALWNLITKSPWTTDSPLLPTIRFNSLQYRGLRRSFVSPSLYLQVHLSIHVPISVSFSWTKRFPWTLSDWPCLLEV